jgi:hypothetical protein
MSDNFGFVLAVICTAFFSWTGYLVGQESAYTDVCKQKQGVSVKVSGQYVCLKGERL